MKLFSMAAVRRLSFPLLVVGFIIAFIYYTIIFLVINPWLGILTAPGVLNAAVFSSFTIMLLLSYVVAIFKDPGSVPPQYFPAVEANSNSIQEIKRKGGELRYCQKCFHYKPPRTHHCRICKRCVLRMDHHCVWINNCVGYFNYKPFLLLVFYTVVSLFHAVILLLCQIGSDYVNEDEDAALKASALLKRSSSFLSPSDGTSALLRVFCLLLCLVLLITVGILLVWNFYLLFINKTTIEYHEGVRARLLAVEKPNDINVSHPYDLGLFSNLLNSLGPNFMCWFCPNVSSDSSDGIHFPTIFDHNNNDYSDSNTTIHNGLLNR